MMTNDATRCPYYQANSENVKGRWACVIPKDLMQQENVKGLTVPNNREQCEVRVYSFILTMQFGCNLYFSQ